MLYLHYHCQTLHFSSHAQGTSICPPSNLSQTNTVAICRMPSHRQPVPAQPNRQEMSKHLVIFQQTLPAALAINKPLHRHQWMPILSNFCLKIDWTTPLRSASCWIFHKYSSSSPPPSVIPCPPKRFFDRHWRHNISLKSVSPIKGHYGWAGRIARARPIGLSHHFYPSVCINNTSEHEEESQCMTKLTHIVSASIMKWR